MDLSGYYTEALDWTCRLEGVGWPPDLVLYWQGSCLVLAHQIRFEAVLLLWAMPMSLPQIIAHTSLKVVLWGIWQIWQKDMIVSWCWDQTGCFHMHLLQVFWPSGLDLESSGLGFQLVGVVCLQLYYILFCSWRSGGVVEVVMSWVVFLVVDGSSIYIDSSRDS